MRNRLWRSRFWLVGGEERFAPGQERAVASKQDSALCCRSWVSPGCDVHQCYAFPPEPQCTWSSSGELAAPVGSQARWQGLVERDVVAFKGLGHLCCIQVVLGSEMLGCESTSQQQAGKQILTGNLNPAWSRPQHLLISIKCPFLGLPSVLFVFSSFL